MRTIIWFVYFWLHLLYISGSMLRAASLSKSGKSKELYSLLSKITFQWARNLLWVAGVKIEASGLENIPDEPVVFVSNHQGDFDIPILFFVLKKPIGFVAKIEILKMPLIRTWMKLLKCIFIDRNDVRQTLNALGSASEILKDGRSLLIFPEGTRSKSSEINEFKAGAFKVALSSSAPIVPILIDGSYKIMESQGFWIKPGVVSVKVLPQIITKDMSRERAKGLGDEIKELLLASR
ncbi:MAG: lysophospholipid acyltransferase family protein [Eubacteriales bacterium]